MICPYCRAGIKGHPNKKFCNSKCKDRYHNRLNPRGKFKHLKETQEEAEERLREEDHKYCMDAQEASESPGGFFG